jgi:serine/threonine protein phosphatase PrpC
MKPASGVKTGEYTGPPPIADVPPPPAISAKVRVDIAALSDPGKVRTNNEDHYVVVRFERALETLLTNLPPGQVPSRFAEIGYGMVVADGVGGASAGEVASQMAISTLINLVLHTPDWMMRVGDLEAKELMQRMTDRFEVVDAVLRDQAEIDPSRAGMGTTMTLALSVGHDLFLAYIGDSRAYLLRKGALHQLTRDHTLVQGLVELGIIGPEQAATHRLKHVLTRVLGPGKDRMGAEVQRVVLADEDQVLLCTDGLTDMVSPAAITAGLRDSQSSEAACRALVDKALENGGRDNVTVVVAKYRIPSGAE